METKMYYFGTQLDTAGHFFWELQNDYMFRDKSGTIWWDLFNPEKDIVRPKGAYMMKGETEFRQENGYSIYAIEGSCIDKRWGTKSVFFVKGLVAKDELKELILNQPMACIIISKMPFEVKW